MLNLSRIQSELERAKEKLRSVEETIQKVEGRAFSNGPVRYGGLKNEYHSNKMRNPIAPEDAKNQRRRIIASTIDTRIQRLPIDDSPFGLKRGLREKREPGLGLKRQTGDNRPQGVFARLSEAPYHQADEEDEDDFGKKPTLPSRVYTTTTEVPSRQEVIAAQAQDEQSKERNKRMFGALVGTLQKFRKEETRVREREEKRMKVEKKLEENAKREKEKLMQEKRELFLEKKRREVEIKRIEWSLNRVKEYEAWEANVMPLKNFIQTQAKPHIFYLPTAHNAKTEERLAHSQKLVERMIEKRKTNLKEEIENSEKKARKAAAEEAEEEEAENIPEDNDESCNTEQQMQIDFEPKNKENGYFEEVKNDKASSPKHLENADDVNKMEEEENWVAQEPSAKESGEILQRQDDSNSKQETKEEMPVAVNKNWSNELNSPVGVRANDGADEGPSDEIKGGKEEEKSAAREIRENKEIENEESIGVNAEERVEESSEANAKGEPLSGESERVAQQETNPDAGKSNDSNLGKNAEETTGKTPLLSESEANTEDSLKKKIDSQEEKNKAGETSKKEKSPGRKTRRRSRSPRKSRSPRNSSRNKRRRSSSRQRRVSRRLSSSSSPPKKARRERVPASRQGQKNLTSRKRSPPGRTRRRRRSSSQSSGSGSPRKERSRSPTSSSSNSD